MRKLLVILLAFLIAGFVHAQPGGGGGLYFRGVYDKHRNKLDIEHDSELKVRIFILEDRGIHSRITNELVSPFGRRGEMGLPPIHDYTGNWKSTAVERLLIIYRRDTMMTDFSGIWSSNGMGSVEELDSLIIQPGYFVSETAGKRGQRGQPFYKGKNDFSFLLEKNLPAVFFLNKGEHFLRMDSSVFYVHKALAMGLDNENQQEAYTILYQRYSGDKLCQKEAGQALKMLIELTPLFSNEKDMNLDHLMQKNTANDLRNLLDLTRSWRGRQMNNRTSDTLLWLSLRGLFKLKYLGDQKGGVKDLKELCRKLEGKTYDHFQSYISVCFYLGWSEYCSGNRKAAYAEWKILEEDQDFNQSIPNGDYEYFLYYLRPELKLDSLVSAHPTDGELYLARNYYLINEKFVGNVYTDKYVSLSDIDEAENLGIRDYRISYYKAWMHYRVMNKLFFTYKRSTRQDSLLHEEGLMALCEINKAIQLEPGNYLCCGLRKSIIQTIDQKTRDGLTAEWQSDNLTYDKGRKNWRFKN